MATSSLFLGLATYGFLTFEVRVGGGVDRGNEDKDCRGARGRPNCDGRDRLRLDRDCEKDASEKAGDTVRLE